MAGFKSKRSGENSGLPADLPIEPYTPNGDNKKTSEYIVNNRQAIPYNRTDNYKICKANKNRYVGIAINCGTVEDEGNSMSRWFKSFFSGIDYSSSSVINVFTLVSEESMNTIGNDIGNQYEVLLYGDISGSRLNPNEKVEVIGKVNGDNQIEARAITKINSRVRIKVKGALSAGIVRFVTIFIVILPFALAIILALANS